MFQLQWFAEDKCETITKLKLSMLTVLIFSNRTLRMTFNAHFAHFLGYVLVFISLLNLKVTREIILGDSNQF